MLYNDTVILLFAKAPLEGEVNTRLIPDIGVQAATKLQYDLIHRRLKMLDKADLCDVRLMCSPDVNDAFFQECQRQYHVTLHAQSEGDIGDRMLYGIKAASQHYQYCIVIGTDAPALAADEIQQAIEKLKQGISVVLVPAEDGGYVLIGMQQVYEALFKDINWGSEQVMAQTRSRLADENIIYSELTTCWDIDRVEDYRRYLQLKDGTAIQA
jgi:rSAM/selenodomain-associated transferase 1